MSELIDRKALLDSIYKNLPMMPSMAGMTAEEMRLRIAALIENAPTDSPWHSTEEEESPSPKPTDPLPIRGVEYVPTKVDVQTGIVTYELRERIEP